MPKSGASGYIPGFDGIRALAIALVLFDHSVIFDEFTSLRFIGLEAGYAGVAVFFVLSGYLITILLLREEDKTGRISLGMFYLRRALRLFPALWLYLATVAVIWTAGCLPDHPWHSFVSSLLYIRNLVGRGHETDHLWSLSIEEQFYLLWPLVLICLPRQNHARLAFALWGLAAVTIWRVYAAQTGLASAGALYIRSDFRFDAPLFGCALALTQRVFPASTSWLNSSAWRCAILTNVGVAAVVVWVGFRLSQEFYRGLESTVVCVLALFLILSQVGVQGRGSQWLAWSPLVLLGRISYGVYLWQQLFIGPLVPGFDWLRVFPVGLAATLATASLSYQFLEQPLIRLKDVWLHKS